MNKDTIQEIIEANRPQIEEAVNKQILEDITSSIGWSLRDCTSGIVKEFVEAEVKPAVQKHLQMNKETLIAAICKEVPNIAEGLAGAISARIAKALTDDYKCTKVLRELF